MDEVVGQEHITGLLKQALKKGVISHAYLLTGPRGVGKTSVARILAHEINQLPYSDDPHLDIIEIDAASNRRIDDVRDLRDKVRIAPVSAKYKVYIIDEVHMLTTESFNALLKTLEEPPEHAVFILATTEVHKVPATILSRTQRFHFRPVHEEKVASHLKQIASKEKIEADDDALLLIARHGGGSFRDSIGLLDQLSSSGEKITKHIVETTLGLVASEHVESLLEDILAHKTKSVLATLKELNDNGTSAVVLGDQLVQSLSQRADQQPGLFGLINELLDVSRAHNPFVKLMATLVNYCESHKPKTVAARTSPQPVISSPVTPTQPKKVPEQVSPPKPEAIPKPTVKPSGEFNWDDVLSAAKKHHAPLYSVLNRAQFQYTDDTLTLNFIYTLHRKKLEQPQYRAQLTALIKDVCGLSPTVVVKDGKALDETASAVAAIMGGGEPVNA